MGVVLRVVPKEHWEIIREYIHDSGVLLMPEELAKEKSIEDGDYANYDFGGEADCWVDFATDDSHLVFQYLKDEKDNWESEIE